MPRTDQNSCPQRAVLAAQVPAAMGGLVAAHAAQSLELTGAGGCQ
jgi:hypothetical protein